MWKPSGACYSHLTNNLRSPTDSDNSPTDNLDGLSHTKDGYVLSNGVTIYSGLSSVERQTLVDLVNCYDIWGANPGVIRIPEDQWMTVSLVHGWETKLPKSKVYTLGPKDRAVVNEAFQSLHDQGKMEYATNRTTTGFPVFVVWRTIHRPGKEPERKGRAVDLRGLNKVTIRDVYPIPTQDDIFHQYLRSAHPSS